MPNEWTKSPKYMGAKYYADLSERLVLYLDPTEVSLIPCLRQRAALEGRRIRQYKAKGSMITEVHLGDVTEVPKTPLTKPQQAFLERVRREGEVVQNGRARKTIEALHRQGLVEYDFDFRINAYDRSELFTVRPAKEGS